MKVMVLVKGDANYEAGAIPSTPRRVRPPAITALAMPDAAVFVRAAKYSVCDESSSWEKMRARGWPAVTMAPVVLTSSCSTHPATRVWTCEIVDSSGTIVATARTDCVKDSRRTVSTRISRAWTVAALTSTGTRS